jgi:phosphatidylglycerophosphatase A
MRDRIADFLATFFYVGYVPFAPGSVASLVAACLFFYLPHFSPAIYLVILLAGFVLGVIVSGYASKQLGCHDPSKVVIDEVVGMWLAVFLVPKTLGWYLGAFLLFRFFDILKPFPVNIFEHFPWGFGIMLDDLASGFLSFLIILGLRACLGL